MYSDPDYVPPRARCHERDFRSRLLESAVDRLFGDARSVAGNDAGRFAGTAEDIVPMGKIVRVIDHLSDRDRENNAKHDAILKEVLTQEK